jgi:hypothetical protein
MSVLASAALIGAFSDTHAEMPAGYWSVEQARPILEKTLRVHLSPSLETLSAQERDAVQLLLETGRIMHRLYEHSRHPQALAARDELERLHRTANEPQRTQMLLDLYRLGRGPIITTLENERYAFLPVDPETPGKNVYPLAIEREELDQALAAKPGLRAPLLHLRHVVRRTTAANLDRDLETLERFPALSTLHPDLAADLSALQEDPKAAPFYELPYSVAFAEELMEAYRLLNEAALLLDSADPAFARFLRNRGRDLLSDDYESGDAAWVTGRFNKLNAQIGSYETYDDHLYGVKSFFSLSLLLRDHERSAELAAATGGLQDIEDALPYESTRKIREDIPVSVYKVIADFGQSRTANTATILPNESYLARQYGRTILLRGNILTHPKIFAIARASFEAAVHEDHHADLSQEANLYRILWHEVGHYLGVDRASDGRDLGAALQDASDLYEELKADLVSLFAARLLAERGVYSTERLRAVYASGVLRVLQKTRPRRDQPYQTMQLMQWNWFLQNGAVSFDRAYGTLRIAYDRYHDAVESMLAEVLAIQGAGDRSRAESFVERYTAWDDDLHGVIASNMKAQETYRYTLVTYEALGDPAPR